MVNEKVGKYEYHFSIPTGINKSNDDYNHYTVLHIPLHQVLTIKPLFDYIVDSIKTDVENSIMYSIRLDTVDTDTSEILNSHAIENISLKRDYFEKLVSAVGYSNNNIQKTRFTINNISDCIGVNIINPKTGYSGYGLANMCQNYADEWLEKNIKSITIQLPSGVIEIDTLSVSISYTAQLVCNHDSSDNIPENGNLSLYEIVLATRGTKENN